MCEINKRKLRRFLSVYPWFAGFSYDLLFWIAVDSLFLQIAKGFSLYQIVRSTTISGAVGILLQLPLLKIVNKLGNTWTVRIGVIMALIAALLFTLGNAFWILTAARILYELSASLKGMMNVTLDHNLALEEREHEFVQYSTKGLTVYSVLTMVISLFASSLFNIHHYLPMVCCIACCFVSLFLSRYIVDYSESRTQDTKGQSAPRDKLRFSGILVLSILSFGSFFGIVNNGQADGKLFVQDEMLKLLSQQTTALFIGVMLFVSRVVRVLANTVYARVYRKMGDTAGILLAAFLVLSFALLLTGNALGAVPAIKFTVMGIGYIIVLFIRDPFKLYINNIVLLNSAPKDHQQLMMLLEMARKLMAVAISFSVTWILSSHPMVWAVVLYCILALISAAVSFFLYRALKKL